MNATIKSVCTATGVAAASRGVEADERSAEESVENAMRDLELMGAQFSDFMRWQDMWFTQVSGNANHIKTGNFTSDFKDQVRLIADCMRANSREWSVVMKDDLEKTVDTLRNVRRKIKTPPAVDARRAASRMEVEVEGTSNDRFCELYMELRENIDELLGVMFRTKVSTITPDILTAWAVKVEMLYTPEIDLPASKITLPQQEITTFLVFYALAANCADQDRLTTVMDSYETLWGDLRERFESNVRSTVKKGVGRAVDMHSPVTQMFFTELCAFNQLFSSDCQDIFARNTKLLFIVYLYCLYKTCECKVQMDFDLKEMWTQFLRSPSDFKGRSEFIDMFSQHFTFVSDVHELLEECDADFGHLCTSAKGLVEVVEDDHEGGPGDDDDEDEDEDEDAQYGDGAPYQCGVAFGDGGEDGGQEW